MSDQHGRDWTEEEKYALLTVILRNSGVPSTSLFGIFRQFNVSPPWPDMPLPPGRSLNECRQQFESMWQTHQSQPSYRQPEPWQGPLPPAAFPAMNPGPAHAPPHQAPHDAFGSRKRPFYPPERPPAFPRAIQPRPPLSGGQFSSESGSPAPTSPGWVEGAAGKSAEPPRKRGRPSKAESERRKAEAEARGETYPAPRRRTSMGKLPATPSGAASATSDSSMVSPMQTAQTPEMPKQDKGPEAPVSTGQATRASPLTSEVPDTDPVRGIIRSQANQDRRLPLPHEFGARTSPPESIYSHTRAMEHPYHGLSTSRPEENTTQPTTARQIIQHSEAPTSGGGYLPAISHSAGATT
ncbi:conserved hypothetical protein [Talaromyces stipitatus ATCC 10500]|uniref:Uncharacterized protein n=1 Tax=Talaromyces stipitatus (strain ATCC 10500 / CBS 375.48 / QM 6759 / NRRL 1006) TaxID=441959 RepID=B8MDN8_TALSN|nr:uncharacterized protein TSTA_120170 [Talaromyces stipitatus ATCC 10500]EED18267.1 conserved hypothetical protein [Talaromyces stipitatus ATCC 10500]